MKCAIMQPHYFPWPGYFNLMSKVNKFIFLDDAQFSKNSWHNRNLILSKKKKIWITVPLKSSQIKTKIMEKKIDIDKEWQLKHVKTLSQSYSKHLYSKDIFELIDFLQNLNYQNLSDLNIRIIKFIASKLKIDVEFINSSLFSIDDKRTTKLIKILEKIGATEYFSPKGGEEYLQSDNFEKLTTVKLKINNYESKNYNQKNLDRFISNLSIIDVIANCGWTGTAKYVK